jgi:hypothetical protein
MFGIRVVTQPPGTVLPHELAGERPPVVAELMARLDIAVQQRNAPATQRIIAELSRTGDGDWLLRQFFAAGLTVLAAQASETG